MPLIACPDCSTEFSDRAPSCPKCGGPNDAAAKAPLKPCEDCGTPFPLDVASCPKCAGPREPLKATPTSPSPGSARLAALAKFPSITEKIPAKQRAMLKENEQALHFAYTGFKGGCAGGGVSQDQWLLITSERVLYEATVRDNQGALAALTEKRLSGAIPLSKISYVGSQTFQRQSGCNQVKAVGLVINSGGGHIEILIPTEVEGNRCKDILERIIG